MKDTRELYEAPVAEIEKIETEDVLLISVITDKRGEVTEFKWEW